MFRTVLGNADYSLTTPNYPGNYPADKTLYWVLTAAEGDRIQMDFESFDLSLDDSVSVSMRSVKWCTAARAEMRTSLFPLWWWRSDIAKTKGIAAHF